MLPELNFDNRFIRELPADPRTDAAPRQVHGACYSKVTPAPVAAPLRVAYSAAMAAELGLSAPACESDAFTQVFAGNRLLDGMEPYATCYGGHQFGQWAGQLGDGRAINLGEVIAPAGQRWALQLKGAGLTPYSRNADGLAVLRSSLREFICSEAMHHLGVPTTRALSLMLTGEQVMRDMFYNGNPQWEPGAVVCRVAPSFTRFGHFQIFSARSEYDILKQLVDYTIRTDFPELGEPNPAVYGQWFTEICRRTAQMIAHWQRVGFVHGVMNTDNMSILGLTIDYGPYGWLEDYNPDWTPNTTDAGRRRYRFGQQSQIAYWNLVQLANALYPLFNQVQPLEAGLAVYAETFETQWQTMMANKLGVSRFEPADTALIGRLLALLAQVETDMTLFFRRLADWDVSEVLNTQLPAVLLEAYYRSEQLTEEYCNAMLDWLRAYAQRLLQDPDADGRKARMNAVNPLYVPRNYLAQLAIDKAEQGDFSLLHEWQAVLQNPYQEQAGKAMFAQKRPDWARQRAGCSMLSCSS